MTNPMSQMKFVREKLIKTDIPVLLSKLVQDGKKEDALRLLIAWGTHEKDNEAIWNDAKALL